MLKNAPHSIDVQDFQFKLRSRLKIFDNQNPDIFHKPCNLVACASRFSLVCIGTNVAQFQAIQFKQFEDIIDSKKEVEDYPRRTVPLPSPPIYLSLNCEHTILAVVVVKDACPFAIFYDVKSFWQKDFKIIEQVRLSATPGVYVVDVGWNPALASVFTVCKSDGSLNVIELKQPGLEINEIPSAAGCTSFSWSPKGKQIAVGCNSGKITQYKPDLKAVKAINSPPLQETHSVLSLLWISNYQFIGLYHRGDSANLIVVDAPKTGDVVYTNFSDICYSNGNARTAQFYLLLQQQWNTLLVASGNSMEIGVLGAQGENWSQWMMGDAARAELPLNSNHQETFPIGVAMDTASTQQLPWGEGFLPPTPYLLLLSNYGTLCCFHVINLKAGIPSLCSPPDHISDVSGSEMFVKTELKTIVKDAPKPIAFSEEITLTPIAKSTPVPLAAKYQQLYPKVTEQPVAKLLEIVSEGTPKKPEPVKEMKVSVPEPLVMKSIPEVQLDKSQDHETEAMCATLIREEYMLLESELNATLQQGRGLKIDLGTDADKTTLLTLTTAVENFFKAMSELCSSQSSEVHILKHNLLQAWAWYEDAKSRSNCKDPSMLLVIKAQPLDSASQKQLSDIRHLDYYLESQLSQAHRALDEQWDTFQDYCKKKYKLEMPTLEKIFQTLVKQNAIIQKESYVLKDISNKMRNKPRSALGTSILTTLSETKDVEDEIRRLRLNPDDIKTLQYEHVKNREKLLTKPKVDNLKKFLKNRAFPRIKPVQPKMSSSIIQSSSGSRPTRKVAEILPKKLDFDAPSPIEGLKTFTMNFQANPSAFVSTSAATAPFNLSSLVTKPAVTAATFGQATTSTSSIFGNLTGNTSASKFAPIVTTQSSKPSTFTIISSHGTSQAVATQAQTFIPGLKIPCAATPIPKPQSPAVTTKSLFGASGNENTSIFANTGTKTVTFGAAVPSTKSAAPTFGATTVAVKPENTPNTKSQFATPFGASTSSVTSVATPDSTTFSKPVATVVTVGSTSIFAVSTTSSSPATTRGVVFFGSATNATSATANSPLNLSSSTVSTTKSIFGAGAASVFTAASSTTSIFSGNTSASNADTKPISIFNISQSSSQTAFDTASTATSNSSFFGSASISATPASDTSIFGATPTNSANSIFHTPVTASTAATTSLPVTTAATSSVFSAATSTSVAATTAAATTAVTTAATSLPKTFLSATSSSIFAPVSSSTTSASAPATTSFFGAAAATSTPFFGTPSETQFATPITTSTPTFGGGEVTASTASVFATTPTTSTPVAFGTTPATSATTFGTPPVAAVTPSVFGATTPSTAFGGTPATSVFGTPTTSASVFATPTSTTSVFGSAPVSSSAPVFGSTSSSVFGNAATSVAASPAFGAATAATTAAPFGTTPGTPIFGTATTASQIFGATPAATTTQMFGFAKQSGSAFGTAPTTTNQSTIFGGQSQQFGTTGSFGSGAASPFAQPQNFSTPAFGGGGTNVFAAAASTFGQSTGSIFGGGATPTATTTASGMFGSSGFGSGGSIFGGGSTQQNPSFGQTTQTGGAFGFGSLNVTPTTASTGVFGQSGASTAANPFGGQAQKFGTDTNKSLFAGTPTSSGQGFGTSGGSIFGGSSFGNGNAFGNQSVFGQQQQQQQSNFGQSSFGSNPSFGQQQQQTSGPFSGGSFSVGQTGFGAATGNSAFGGASPSASGAFGTAPVFGSNTGFGSGPSFGGAPTFGSTPAFGSPQKVFGNTPTSSFGSEPAQNTGFGNLANQQTVGFGNLAQQAASSPSTAFSGNSSFSSWR